MLIPRAFRLLLPPILTLAMLPSLGLGQAKPGQAPSTGAKGTSLIQVRARDGGFLAEGIRARIRTAQNVGQVESFLEGLTMDTVRVIGVEPGPVIHLRSGAEVLAAAIVQGRGFETGDAPEAMVVGKTFAQNNKTALGLSIPAMLTKDHFPPIIVGGQGFSIIGIYATGDPKADDQVLVLLPMAQKLLSQPGRLSGLFVTPASPAATDQVAKDLRRVLADGVEVTPLARRPKRAGPDVKSRSRVADAEAGDARRGIIGTRGILRRGRGLRPGGGDRFAGRGGQRQGGPGRARDSGLNQARPTPRGEVGHLCRAHPGRLRGAASRRDGEAPRGHGRRDGRARRPSSHGRGWDILGTAAPDDAGALGHTPDVGHPRGTREVTFAESVTGR